jgi:hypothetical protein
MVLWVFNPFVRADLSLSHGYIIGYREVKRKNLARVSPREIILYIVSVTLGASLLPGALTTWLSYTPSNATVAAIWIVAAVIIVIGLVLDFMPD